MCSQNIQNLYNIFCANIASIIGLTELILKGVIAYGVIDIGTVTYIHYKSLSSNIVTSCTGRLGRGVIILCVMESCRPLLMFPWKFIYLLSKVLIPTKDNLLMVRVSAINWFTLNITFLFRLGKCQPIMEQLYFQHRMLLQREFKQFYLSQ